MSSYCSLSSSSSHVFSRFFFHRSAHHRDLHSFPTRRSSDLVDSLPDLEGRTVQVHPKPLGTVRFRGVVRGLTLQQVDRKSTRLNSSHRCISYAVFCLKKKK